MAQNEEMPTFKLVLVGDGGVGKVISFPLYTNDKLIFIIDDIREATLDW